SLSLEMVFRNRDQLPAAEIPNYFGSMRWSIQASRLAAPDVEQRPDVPSDSCCFRFSKARVAVDLLHGFAKPRSPFQRSLPEQWHAAPTINRGKWLFPTR